MPVSDSVAALGTVSSVGADAEHLRYLWRDGELVPWEEATVHVNAVGHASVSAVFEGMKSYWNPDHEELYVFRLRDHMVRLVESAHIARLTLAYSLDELCEAVLTLLRANECRSSTYVRPWVFASGIIHEHIVPPDTPTVVVIDTWGFTTALGTQRSCRACVSSWVRISDNSMPPRLKTFSNYHNGRLGMIEARTNGYDWPIFLNDHGKVTEGPGACVILVKDNQLVTPSLSSNVLDSITRRSLLALARDQLELPVVEREVDRTELYVADELFFVGTGWEILPIVHIDGFTVGDGTAGPVAEALDGVYHAVVTGRSRAYSDWITPVWGRGHDRAAADPAEIDVTVPATSRGPSLQRGL